MTPLEQRAQARKYDVNLTWHFAELEPGIFALFNPVHRDLVCIGTIEEVLAAYRAREPYVHKPRAPSKPLPAGLAKIEINI